MEGECGYLYIKNGKIIGSDSSGKNVSLGKPFKITLPGYYRIKDGIPKIVVGELEPTDVYAWSRDFKHYYDKRMEATGKNTLEETYGGNKEVEVITNPTTEKMQEAEKGFDDTFKTMTW